MQPTAPPVPMAHVEHAMNVRLFPARTSAPEEVFGPHTKVLSPIGCNSLAPFLLLTKTELLTMPGIGKNRQQLVAALLEKRGLRTRLCEESVHTRAKTLFGSVADTPAQALLVVSALSGQGTSAYFAESPALRVMVKLAPKLTIGQVVAYIDSDLELFFIDQDVSIDKRHVANIKVELESRIPNWRLSMS